MTNKQKQKQKKSRERRKKQPWLGETANADGYEAKADGVSD